VIIAKLFANALDMHVYRARISKEVKSPDLLEQLFSGEYLAGMTGEEVQ
jgi:hypothetical protein